MADAVLHPGSVAASQRPLALPLLLVGFGLMRAATVLASGAGLHVDEAQYWDWSRTLQWGYYSKPPAIAALIAASTSLFGDGLLAVRVLTMVCWLGASLVLWRLGSAMGSERAGRWAALCLAATPASGLLGLVATTDAPLLLCWSLTMLFAWHAIGSDRPGPWWCAVGLALGLGLLSKYTMAAAWLSLAWLVHSTRRRADLFGLAGATALALVVLLPNLAWNAAHGWPTLRHTAEITVGSSGGRGAAAVAASLIEYLGGQLLLAGPALLGLMVLLMRQGGRSLESFGRAGQPTRFALVFALPLLGIGLLQALHARTQMNWTAPALLGLSLWVGWRAVLVAAPTRWLVIATLMGVALTSLLAVAGDLRRFAPASVATARACDVWARMRGWDEALDALRPALSAQPGMAVRADTRDIVTHARYAWRDLSRTVHAVPFAGSPRHHYEMLAGRDAIPADEPWLLLSGQPEVRLAKAYPGATLLAESDRAAVVLRLWLVPARSGVAP